MIEFDIKLALVILIILFVLYIIYMNRNIEQKSIHEKTPLKIKLYYVEWCGHCKKMMPEWNKLENYYNGSRDIMVEKVNTSNDIAKKENIKGFPTIRLYKDSNIIEYDGPRDMNGFKIFLNKHKN